MPYQEHLTTLAHELACMPSLERVVAWLDAHQEQCCGALVAALKHLSDNLLTQDTPRVAHIAACCMRVAERVPANERDEALLLATWAMGNACSLTATDQEALSYYAQAQQHAARRGERVILARITCNIGARLCQLGRYAEARAAIEESRMLTRADDPPDNRIALDLHYGVLLDSMGKSRDALVAYQRAAACARAAGHVARLTELLCNIAVVDEQLGNLPAAEQAYQEALGMAQQQQQVINEGKIAMNLGVLYTAQGRLAEAQGMLRHAERRFASQGAAGEAACVQYYQAALSRTLGLADAAIALAQQAITTLTRLAWQEDLALALMELLRAQRQSHCHAAAAATMSAALEIWERLGNRPRMGELLGERAMLALTHHRFHDALTDARTALHHFAASQEARPLWEARARLVEAQVLARTGRLEAAHQVYGVLRDTARTSGDHWTLQAALLGLSSLAATGGAFDTASHYVQQAADAVEQVRATLTVEELKARFLEQHSQVYDALVTLAATSGDAGATLTAMLRAKGGGLLDLIQAEHTMQTLAAEEQTELEHLRRHLAWARMQVSQVKRGTSATGHDDYDRLHMQQSEQRVLTLLRKRQRSPSFLPPSAMLNAADLAHYLPHESALIEYYISETTLWGVLLTADGRGDLRLLGPWSDAEADLLADLDVLFATVVAKSSAARGATPPDMHRVQRRLHTLWQRLIAPWGTLPAHLFIAPHGALGSLPFAALWDGQHYLGDTHTVAMLPSGALLTLPAPPPAAVGETLVLGYSDHGRIPATLHEAALVGTMLPGARVALEGAATSSMLCSITAPPKVLHIAAHAALRNDAPLFSTVRLSDGDMALETWYDLPLRGTRLVVLSACDTGRVAEQGGPLLAFQGALLSIGVRSLVCSLWHANDEAAAALMHHFYHAWRGGASPAVALQQAQHRVRTLPTMEHPALWAPFICCGAGAHTPHAG